MDKNYNLRNGVSPLEEVPVFDPIPLFLQVPSQHCGDMVRPNVGMFGDYEFMENLMNIEKD